jgi:4-diphosphocytidyl-2-C-methyl-D-erythritol kinase
MDSPLSPDPAAQVVQRCAPLKINLALHVTARRGDGYHDLDTLAVFARTGDTVRVAAAGGLRLTVEGPLAHHAPQGPHNLVFRAAETLLAHAGGRTGAAITLEKCVPAGAGFGGGSSDAAATLLALNDWWGLHLAQPELARLGAEIGADVPMCLTTRALRARGVGDVIDPIEGWPELPMVLVWPGIGLSTPQVFAGLRRRENPPLPPIPASPTVRRAAEWLASTRNDLEDAAIAAAPVVGKALDRLRATGCLLARMSGSGSGCFALYASEGEAEAAAAEIAGREPGWWVMPTIAR